MLLTLYDQRGNEKATLQSNDSSTQDKEVQGDNVLSLGFTLYAFVPIDVNDYVEFCGERYWAIEKYLPTEKSSVEWEYNVQLYGIESLIKRFLVLNTTDGDNEAVFTLTATPVDHVRLIVKCINEGMGTTDWKVGRVEGTDNVVINYEGKYCDEALKDLADAVGVEWWIEGETVNLCRCEWGEAVVLGYGEGLTGLEQDRADNAKFYTRLFPIGSSRNIDRERYGASRLQLPGGAKYVDQPDLVEKYGVIHHYEQEAFSGIYPRRVGEVSSVRSKEVQDSDGKPYTIYYFKDDGLTFDPNDYEIGGLVKRVSFQEGSELAGLGADNDHYFEVNFDSETREFEIITIWPYDDDRQLPGDTLVPKERDKYILWNIRMPDEYYTLAEAEYLSAVEEYNRKHTQDVSRYKGGTDHVWIEESGTELEVGRRVRLKSTEYFPGLGYRDSRITRISRKVNLPSQMDLEIGDALSSGRLEKIDDAISDARSYAGSILGAVNVPDVIRSWDKTTPTDNNIYSARRTHKEFLSKRADDVAQGLIGFVKGLWVKAKGLFGIDEQGDARLNNATMQGDVVSDNFQTGWEGSGYALIKDDNGFSRLEVDELMIRRKLMAREVEIQRETYIGGLISVGDADGTIYKMTPFDSDGERMNVTVYVIGGVAIGVETDTNKIIALDNTVGTAAFYRCYFVRSDDETKVKNRWKVGDMARCDEWDLVKRNGEGDDTLPIENRFYWRLVINTGTETLTDADGVEREYIFIDLAAGYSEQLYSWPAVNGDCYVTQTSTPPSPISPQPPIYGYSVKVWPSAVNSDIPAVGDHVVQNGYVNDERPNRQSIIKIGYNGGTDKTKEFNVFEQIGKDKTSAATQYRYPNNPIKLGSEKTRITADEINFRTHDGLVVPVNTYRGTWTKGTTAYKGEEWTYNGQTYVCKISSTTTAPDASTTDWQLKVAKGADGTSFTAKGDAKAYWLGDDKDLTDWMRDYGEDEGAPLGTWLTDRGQVFVFDAYDATPTEIPSQDGDAYVVSGDEYDTGGATGTRYVQELLVRNGYRWVNLGKIKGTNGTDGLSFVLNPSTIIINETLNSQEQKIYSYNGFIGLSVLEGDTAKTYRITDASMYGEDLLSIEITSNGLRLTDGDDIRITQFVSDAILIHVLVNNKTYELTVPVIVNRAGTSFLTLKDGLAAIGVESMRTVLTTDPVAEQVVVNYVKNGLVVTDDKVQLAMWVENLIMAGVTARQVGNDYYLDFKGQRFNFYDTRNPANPLLRMFFEDGLLHFVDTGGRTRIQMGIPDSETVPVLRYLDNDGRVIYDIGPNGIQFTASQALGLRRRSMSYRQEHTDIPTQPSRYYEDQLLYYLCREALNGVIEDGGSSVWQMLYKQSAGAYVFVSKGEVNVEVTDLDLNTTNTELLTLNNDIQSGAGNSYDKKWVDYLHTSEQALDNMANPYYIMDGIYVDTETRIYNKISEPTDYTAVFNGGWNGHKGYFFNPTPVSFGTSRAVYYRAVRYFKDGIEKAVMNVYWNP